MNTETVEVDGEQLTYEQAFRKMWNWLADNPNSDKEDFFKEHNVRETPSYLCFACESCDMQCNCCPIKWDDSKYRGVVSCGYRTSLYFLWKHSVFLQERAEYARSIANLPWNEKERD